MLNKSLFDANYKKLHAIRSAEIDKEIASLKNPSDAEIFRLQRRKSLGGSDMAAVMGISRFKTQVDLFYEKTGRKSEFGGNLKTVTGITLEPLIAALYSDRTGYKVKKARPVTMKNYSFIVGNFDRLVYQNGKLLCGLECKSVGRIAHDLKDWQGKIRDAWLAGNVYDQNKNLIAESDSINPDYYSQVQCYLAISKLDFWDVAALFGNGDDLKIYRVHRDEEFISRMLADATKFWCDVLEDKVPDPVLQDLKKVQSSAVTIEADNNLISLCAQYRNLKSQIKNLEEKSNTLKNEIAQAVGESEKAITKIDGKIKTLVSFKSSQRESFDLEKFKAEHYDIYKNYLKSIQIRTLRIY